MTLKTVRDPTLPIAPPEEEKDDFDRVTRFRKGQLTTLKELQESVYDDLKDHHELHEDGGSGEISVTGLSGLLANDQHVLDTEVLALAGVADGIASLDGTTKVPIAQMASGTPDGTKFIRDDRTLVVPSSGKIVQVVNYQTGAVATGSTTIPIDDTIPQITEGDEYMTLVITPTNVNNKLLIEVVLNASHSAAVVYIVAALFKNATADALAAGYEIRRTASDPATIVFNHYMAAGTVSAITFRVRAGGHTAGTLTFNGIAAGRIFGGVMVSSITITEIAV